MLDIRRIRKNRRTMSAMTGVTEEEFSDLLPTFTQAWIGAKEKQHETGATKRALGGGRKGFLPTMEEKLFYILFYAKCYPTYDLLGAVWSCNRSNACRRQFELMSLLEEALGRKLELPQRKMRSIDEFLQAFPGVEEVFIDGTERPIRRSKNKDRQKENYSGKKKRHTRKNLVITDRTKRVGFLGPTVSGKTHDFTMLKQHAPPDGMPKRTRKHLDLGFQGFETQFPGHDVSMPKKKPKGGQLTESEKLENKEKSSVRILVENALSGVKRMNVVAQVFRNRKEGFDDQVILVACGLWNYHLSISMR